MPPWPWSISTAGRTVRVTACSRRRPVVQASRVESDAVERLHLADAAAELAVLDAAPEREEAALVLELLGGLALREVDLDLRAVGVADPLHHVVGLRGQPAGVEGEDTRVLVDLREHVDDGHVFDPEARREGDAGMEAVRAPSRGSPGASRTPRGARRLRLRTRVQPHSSRSSSSSDGVRGGRRERLRQGDDGADDDGPR